jgi:hypothetical protein
MKQLNKDHLHEDILLLKSVLVEGAVVSYHDRGGMIEEVQITTSTGKKVLLQANLYDYNSPALFIEEGELPEIAEWERIMNYETKEV